MGRIRPAGPIEVKQSTDPEQWRYVTSEENPADHASRGLTSEQLMASNWFTGPDFLWQEELPKGQVKGGEFADNDPELQKSLVHDTQAKEERSLLDHLHKFSDWARVVKAIARLKRRVKEAIGLKLRSSEATSIEERREAELTIIRMVQEAAFSHEIHNLRHQKDIKTKDKASKLHKLSPFLDERGKRITKPTYLERPIHKTVTLLEADQKTLQTPFTEITGDWWECN